MQNRAQDEVPIQERAPVFRKRASKSSDLAQSFPRVDDLPAAWLSGGDDFDFDGGAFRQGSDLDGGAGGGGGFEVGAVKLVYGLEIGEVGQENGRLDDVSEIQSLCPEHGCDVFHYPPRLCINVAGNDFASLWIQRDLAGTKDEIANTNGLRVRPDCRRGLRGGDDSLHAAMLPVFFADAAKMRSDRAATSPEVAG